MSCCSNCRVDLPENNKTRNLCRPCHNERSAQAMRESRKRKLDEQETTKRELIQVLISLDLAILLDATKKGKEPPPMKMKQYSTLEIPVLLQYLHSKTKQVISIKQ
jgi:hypothetical protein